MANLGRRHFTPCVVAAHFSPRSWMGFLKYLGLLGLMFLAACEAGNSQNEGPHYSDTPAAGGDMPVYRLAVSLGYNPAKLSTAYQPLIDHLNRSMPLARFELESTRDFKAYEAKFRAREPEFLLPNPWQTLEAMKAGYRVIAMAGDAEDFRGLFIVRKDSVIHQIADLKGKIVSYPSPTALAACIMPQYFLHSRGIDVNKDVDNHYVGSQESSIMHAYLKQSDLAVSWPTSWRLFQKDHARKAAELKVLWETPHLLNNAVMVRDDVPNEVREEVRQVLLSLDHDQDGRKLLAGMETARFHAADDASYEPVRQFIERFEREVRQVEGN